MKKQIEIIVFVCLVVLGGCTSSSDPAPTPVVPPSIATLSAPEKNKTCETGTSISESQREVLFSWFPANNTEYYDILITDLNTNTVSKVEKIVGSSTKVILTKGTPYSWTLISKSSKTDKTGTSETWNFYLAGTGATNYAPFPATIVAPLPGAKVSPQGNKVTLKWKGTDPEDDKLTYTVFCDAIDGKQPPLPALTNLTAASVDVTVDAGKIYYWRVKSSDGSNSSTTVVYQFKTP
jgi:hypothetical protein